ncbi:tripartite tricarboxylate transporter TctB family protein [Sediminivirga luteola]|uniref:tripartite tricarboxylate transporter TctB family protein n=1 Tax=Sediminivirga luteola TaxID=1774748 RepID=UPI001F5AEA8C|nr:tripartite tricarboxylate transporter TctB family protein [Sediminivirga luteola]MCI2266401.1 tripartite tricarboxylate transporter TctB family protein [Sediminivirga luteola]
MSTPAMTPAMAAWKRHRSDLIGTAVLGTVGTIAAVMGLGYGVFTEGNRVGPGFLPVVVGLFILVAAGLELGRILFAGRALSEGSVMALVEDVEQEAAEQISETRREEQRDTFGRTAKQRNWAPLYIFAVLAAALLLVDLVGLVLSFALAVAFLIIVIERRPWWVGLLATAGAVAFIVVIFKALLGIPLPSGYLGLI